MEVVGLLGKQAPLRAAAPLMSALPCTTHSQVAEPKPSPLTCLAQAAVPFASKLHFKQPLPGGAAAGQAHAGDAFGRGGICWRDGCGAGWGVQSIDNPQPKSS